ncbi:MAG: efflux RND transporter periplasmic adaptor subunit [Burkholderiaceae bacterium]|jgi:RND family efflux transporter MFP subunit|nr:efflux RND transporter periplasmic adaptor subunit [Burkholderiaceae bacterium]
MQAGAGALVLMMGLPSWAAADGFECLLEPWQVVEVRAPVDGMIATIAVNRGDAIRKGQPLVVLQSEAEKMALESAAYRSRMEGQIAAARNRIDYASKKLARLEDLKKDNFLSAQAGDEALAEKRLAESELQSALEARELARIEWVRTRELLALRTMTAPFAGVVVDRMLNPGDLAESGSGRKPVLKVAQIDPIRADVALPAALFGQVKPGAKAAVTSLVGGGRFNGTVRSVDRVIDAASGTFVARLEVPNPQGQVPGGARCSASIEGVTPPPRAAAGKSKLGTE